MRQNMILSSFILLLSYISIVLCGSGPKNKLIHALDTETKQYYISQSPDNFYQAYQFCRLQGMQLLTINSASESQAVEDVLRNRDFNETTFLWTSGNRLGGEVDFFWLSTGKFITYSDWMTVTKEPNNSGGSEFCVELRRLPDIPDPTNVTKFYQWNDIDCKYSRHFICETVSNACTQ